MEFAGSIPAALNGRGVGGQDANRRSLEWLFRKMLTDVVAAARSKIRSTIRSTKSEVLYDLGGLRRSPRACKSLKNLKRQDCHGRGRGFEPRRPRHKPIRINGLWRIKSGSLNSTVLYGTQLSKPYRTQANIISTCLRLPFLVFATLSCIQYHSIEFIRYRSGS